MVFYILVFHPIFGLFLGILGALFRKENLTREANVENSLVILCYLSTVNNINNSNCVWRWDFLIASKLRVSFFILG